MVDGAQHRAAWLRKEDLGSTVHHQASQPLTCFVISCAYHNDQPKLYRSPFLYLKHTAPSSPTLLVAYVCCCVGELIPSPPPPPRVRCFVLVVHGGGTRRQVFQGHNLPQGDPGIHAPGTYARRTSVSRTDSLYVVVGIPASLIM